MVDQVQLLRARQQRAQAERDRRERAKLRKLHGITTDTPLRLEDVAALPASAGRAGATERVLHVDTGPAAPSSLERHTRVTGQTYPYIDAEGRYHASNIGTPRLATARDYTKNGWRLPEGFLDQPRFGSPGFPREPIGTFEPVVRMTPRFAGGSRGTRRTLPPCHPPGSTTASRGRSRSPPRVAPILQGA